MSVRYSRTSTILSLLSFLLLLSAVSETHAQWVKLPQFNGRFYNEVYFYDQNLGFITSHDADVLRTTNGGSSWTTVTLPNSTLTPSGNPASSNRDICFVSTSVGYISGEDGIWKSTNGGVNWTNVTPPNPVGTGSASCWFRNADVGVWGYGSCGDTVVTFYRTTDGGANWSGVTYSHTVTDVAVGGMTYQSGTFYASGGSGKFWASTDDGATWTLSNTNSGGWQEDLISTGSSLLIASANGTSCGSTGGGKVLVSFNGGSSWSTTSFPGTVMWGVSMYSSTDGWAVGDVGAAYYTTDGGVNWTESSCGLNVNDRLDDVYMISSTAGFAVGDGVYRFAVNEFVPLPDTIDFGDVIIGTMRGDSAARIRAIGQNGTITARAFAGADAAHFASPGPLTGAQPVPVCDEARTLVRFVPTTVGPKLARLEFTLAGVTNPLIVYLRGNGVRPDMVGPTEERFDTLVCETELLDTLTFGNVGDFPLSIDSAFFINNIGFFSLVSPTLPIEIPPFENRRFVIRARAAGTGRMSGRMLLFTDDPDYADSSWVTELSIYKRRIEVGIPKDTLIIPGRPIDSTSTFCFYYKNLGDGVQTLDHVSAKTGDQTIRPGFSDDFELQPGDSVELCFSARALDTIRRYQTFTLRTAPCDIQTEVTLCYQAAEGRLSYPPSRLIATGCGTSVRDTIIVRNTGNDSAWIESTNLSGADAERFAVVKPATLPASIAPGDSIRLIVTFTPSEKPDYSATLTLLRRNGKEEPIELSGKRNAPVVDVTEQRNDVGRICPDEVVRLVVRLKNSGNLETGEISVRMATSDDRLTLDAVPSGSILPDGDDSVVVVITGSAPGPIDSRIIIEYASDCLENDTVEIVGTVLDRSLEIQPAIIQFGVVPVNRTSVVKTVVRNTSDAAVTLGTIWLGNSAVTVLHPSSDVVLQPGDTVEVTLQFAPEAEVQLGDSLRISAIGECNDEFRVPVRGTGLAEKLYLSGDIDFGTVLCDVPATDSVIIYNAGPESVEIAGITLDNPEKIEITLPGSVPLTILPSDSVVVIVELKRGFYGSASGTVTVTFSDGSLTSLSATITGERSGTDTKFVDEAGEVITRFDLPLFSRCRTEIDTVIRLHNDGNIHDTLDLTSGFPVTIISPLPIVVPPGETVSVAIRAGAGSVGRTDATVQAFSRVCIGEIEAETTVEFVDIADALSAEALQFGRHCVDRTGTMTLTLENSASYPVDIESIGSRSGIFTWSNPSLLTVEAKGSQPVEIAFTPVDETIYDEELIVVIVSPCRDTLRVRVTGEGDPCLLPDITLNPGRGTGRWGKRVSIPIVASGTGFDLVERLRLDLTMLRTLVHPEGIRVDDAFASDWNITGESYDHASGVLRFDLNGPGLTGESASSGQRNGDTLLWIDCLVLRGDDIVTPIELSQVDALPAGGGFHSDPGEFILENYCDAYGRLLRSTGDLTLKTSVPNPAHDRATIEYELPFAGHAVLTIFDQTGAEVVRLLDDSVPAGRRISVLDVSNFPSGTYHVRLSIGLQTLTQRMVVAQ